MRSIVVLLDVRNIDPEEPEFTERCCAERRAKIIRCKTAQAKKQSLGAELCFLAAAKIAEIAQAYCRVSDGRLQPEASGWYMSLTHTRDLAACVLSEVPAGIDAEPVDRKIDSNLAKKIHAAGEDGDLLCCWVQKESYLKRTGEGIRRAMCAFRSDEADGVLKRIALEHYYVFVSLERETDVEVYRFSAEEIKNMLNTSREPKRNLL